MSSIYDWCNAPGGANIDNNIAEANWFRLIT